MTAPGNAMILFTGGARSGKSVFAEALAQAIAAIRRPQGPVAYIATGQAMDDEFKARIAAHRRRRGKRFVTYEEPLRLSRAIDQAARNHVVIMVECIPTWLGNLYYHEPQENLPGRLARLADFIDCNWAAGGGALAEPVLEMARRFLAGDCPAPELQTLGPPLAAAARVLILVTNETGLGLVPATAEGRRFQRAAGPP